MDEMPSQQERRTVFTHLEITEELKEIREEYRMKQVEAIIIMYLIQAIYPPSCMGVLFDDTASDIKGDNTTLTREETSAR